MAANFLHGIETIERDDGSRPIRIVKSAVIALIGTAPAGPVNTLTQCLSERDAAQFGPDVSGFTIPSAFDAIFDHGAGTVLAVNVLDPEIHRDSVAGEAVTFGVDNRVRLDNLAIIELTLKSADGSKTYAANTDYLLDAATGVITRVASGAIAPLGAVKADYTYADPTKVSAADIIGAVNAAGLRTGIKALDDAYNLFGYWPKLLIAPAYCTGLAVSTDLIATAERMGGMALIDAPIGVTPAQALNGRGPLGDINFNTSSEHAILCYPHLKVYDAASDSTRLEPMSQRLAGLIAAKDIERGYWWSPSNSEFKGVIGVERPLSARVDDPQSEVNALNEAGIVTVFNSFGTGLRSWGNRTAAWPTVTHVKNFINVRRTKDIVDESIRYSSLQFVDRPITGALINAVVESVNQFLRKMTGDGALLGGECWYDEARNPPKNLELGNVVFHYKLTIPPPFERGTFETEITDEYLVNLGGA